MAPLHPTTNTRATSAKLLYRRLPEDAGNDLVKGGYDWVNTPPEGVKKTNWASNKYDVKISDIRALPLDAYGLDVTGWAAIHEPTGLTYDDFDDEAKIKSEYYAEIEDILKRETGAFKVTIFDHTIRRQPPKGVHVPDTPDNRQPVPLVHVDQTPDSAANRVRRHDSTEAEQLFKGRVRLINVWRPLKGPVQDKPLAIADSRTLDTKNGLIPSALIYSPENIGQTYSVQYDPAHKWYYLSNQQPDEILLLKCFDSASPADKPVEGIASLTPHTAFEDDAYLGKSVEQPRQSIEVRALVYSTE